jgi:hypothetical protein
MFCLSFLHAQDNKNSLFQKKNHKSHVKLFSTSKIITFLNSHKSAGSCQKQFAKNRSLSHRILSFNFMTKEQKFENLFKTKKIGGGGVQSKYDVKTSNFIFIFLCQDKKFRKILQNLVIKN